MIGQDEQEEEGVLGQGAGGDHSVGALGWGSDRTVAWNNERFPIDSLSSKAC